VQRKKQHQQKRTCDMKHRMAVHHPQYEETGILPNATGQQQLVQQAQSTSAQSAAKDSNDWS
jgi:hypothetical protein